MTDGVLKESKKMDTVEQSIAGTRVGVVESDKRDKTRKVVISYLAKHPKYGKYVKRRTVLHVHDETNQSHAGDVVEVGPCRPMSKTTTWTLIRVMEKRSGVEGGR